MEGNATEFIENGGEELFVTNLADGLNIDTDNIEIISITQGSVIIDYNIIMNE